jgi:hypothetical protein
VQPELAIRIEAAADGACLDRLCRDARALASAIAVSNSYELPPFEGDAELRSWSGLQMVRVTPGRRVVASTERRLGTLADAGVREGSLTRGARHPLFGQND